ncbi:RDD family protein [Actinoplanes hulinensis]|uniref:RDD family protein n=1 Tax=Actinoplanes hulinensis TaxID=1144547 RepID=A0ABS7B7R4_9ACTN|nr:RDD family protein [Actinoplanes hulinensis]
MIDLTVVAGTVAVAVALVGSASLSGSTEGWAELGGFLAVLFGGAAAVVIAVLTVIVAPTAVHGASLGKRLTGIRVVDVNGGRAGWWRSIVREAALPVAYVIAVLILDRLTSSAPGSDPSRSLADDLPVLAGAALLIADLIFGCRPDGRTGHDLIAGTIVTR